MTRKIEFMSDTLYEKIIQECAENSCRVLHLHNFGEPLLDKKLEQRIRYAKSNGIPRVKIFTNGSLLAKDRSRSLIETGLDEIKISFDGATKHEFENIRTPLKYDDVVNMRRSLANEVVRQFGEAMERMWIGHSWDVMEKHYLLQLDEDFAAC